MKVGIALGLTFSARPICPEWAISIAQINYPMGTNTAVIACKSTYESAIPIAEARQQIMEKAIEMGVKYLLYIDDDTAPPVHIARELMYQLEQPDNQDVAICGGIYCSKRDPAEPLVFTEFGHGVHWNWKVGDVFECAGIGTGAMMVRTAACEKLPKPWFKTTDIPATETTWREMETDDLYFCRKVRDAGYRILANGKVLPIHLDYRIQKDGGLIWKPYMLPENSYPVKPRESQTMAAD